MSFQGGSKTESSSTASFIILASSSLNEFSNHFFACSNHSNCPPWTVDAFGGTGTTGAAALKLDRKFIGTLRGIRGHVGLV